MYRHSGSTASYSDTASPSSVASSASANIRATGEGIDLTITARTFGRLTNMQIAFNGSNYVVVVQLDEKDQATILQSDLFDRPNELLVKLATALQEDVTAAQKDSGGGELSAKHARLGHARWQLRDCSSPLGERFVRTSRRGERLAHSARRRLRVGLERGALRRGEVALARDGAAPFLNPAAIVSIRDTDLAFSSHLYTLELTHYSDFRQPGPADARFGSVAINGSGVSANRVDSLPSNVCLFFTIAGLTKRGEPSMGEATPWEGGRQQLAVCLGTVEHSEVRMPSLTLHSPIAGGATSQTGSVERAWNRVQVGPSYSAQVNDQVALGASLQLAYTISSFVLGTSAVSSAADHSLVQTTMGFAGDGRSIDLTGVLGVTYVVQKTVFGASIQIPSLHIWGTYDSTLNQAFAATGAYDAYVTSGNGTFRASPPARLAVGVGRTSGPFTFEVDGFLSFQLGGLLDTDLDVTATAGSETIGPATSSFPTHFRRGARPAANFAAGFEYFVSPGLSILAGGSTSLTMLTPLSPAAPPSLGNLAPARTSSAALSMGIGSYGSAGSLVLGAQLGVGWGDALATNSYVVPNDWAVVSTQSFSGLLILAGSTNFRVLKRTVETVKDVLKHGPGPGALAAPVVDTSMPPPPPASPEASADPATNQVAPGAAVNARDGGADAAPSPAK